MKDCDECLQLEPKNVKAMLRKCEALMAIEQKNEAYKIYSYILKVDPGNAIARKALKNISIRYQIQPLLKFNSQSKIIIFLFRLEIEDVNAQSDGIRLREVESQENDGIDDNLYRNLIIPPNTAPRSKFSNVVINKWK